MRSPRILPILLAPHPLLEQVCAPVELGDPAAALVTRELVDDLIATMIAAPGLGLAAPQVGQLLRVFVVRASVAPGALVRVFINPRFISRSGHLRDSEGCLSLPGLRRQVTRAANVELEYIDRDFKPAKVKVNGATARAIQHENDHLDGVLFTRRP